MPGLRSRRLIRCFQRMHELALARSLVELVDDHAVRHGARHVRRIHVRLGQLSVMTRALYVCFTPAARGSRCEDAVLEIEEVPLTVKCTYCGEIKKPSGRFNFRCPDCGMPTPEVVTGREMQLVSIELDRTQPGPETTMTATPGTCAKQESGNAAL